MFGPLNTIGLDCTLDRLFGGEAGDRPWEKQTARVRQDVGPQWLARPRLILAAEGRQTHPGTDKPQRIDPGGVWLFTLKVGPTPVSPKMV